MTLIELMVVITIIALIGAVVGPQVFKQLGGARTKTAKMQIDDIGAALDLFYLDADRYPATDEGLQALVQAPAGVDKWHGPYLKKKEVPKDPWGNDYHYASPGQHGPYDLSSLGADNKEGGDGDNKDLVSW